MRQRLLCINEGSHTFNKKKEKKASVWVFVLSPGVCRGIPSGYPGPVWAESSSLCCPAPPEATRWTRPTAAQNTGDKGGEREFSLWFKNKKTKKITICINADVQGLLERHQNNTTHTKHFRGLRDDRTIMCEKRKEERSKTKQQTVWTENGRETHQNTPRKEEVQQVMACNREKEGRKGRKSNRLEENRIRVQRRIKKNKRGGAREHPAGV